jgi:hypothetical protein
MNPSAGRTSTTLKWLVPLAAVLSLVAWGYVSVRSTHAWDDAEPEVLNHAWRLANGVDPYTQSPAGEGVCFIDPPEFLHVAYPPVYFVIVATMLKITGLTYIPGKMVSLLAVFLIGLGLASIARTWGIERRTVWWMMSLLVLLPAFLYNTMRVHVQMLAVAFSVWAIALVLRKGNLALVVSALLGALAIYTKQTQFAAPLAILIWLLFKDLKRGLVYLAAMIVFVVPILAWLQATTGGGFLEHTVELNRLPYSLADVPLVMVHWIGPLLILIALAFRDVVRRKQAQKSDLIDIYFVLVFGITVVTCGRLGAHSQYVVELAVATVLITLRTLPDAFTVNRLVQIQAVILLVYAPLFIFLEEGRFGMASNRAAPQVHRVLATAPGEVLSQQSSFSLFASGRLPIQLFDFTALARQGKFDLRRLTVPISAGQFRWVITEFEIENGKMTEDDRERFAPEVVEALKANYVRAESIPPYFIYRPVSR